MKHRAFWIPAVSGLVVGGATIIEGCVPIRGGGSGGDDDDTSADDVTGTWALTRWGTYGYPREYTYESYSYSSYSYESCEKTIGVELEVEADGDVEWRLRRTETGYCPYAYGTGTTVYDGRWTNPSQGVWRIRVDKLELDMNCGPDGDTLECEDDDGARLEFERP